MDTSDMCYGLKKTAVVAVSCEIRVYSCVYKNGAQRCSADCLNK